LKKKSKNPKNKWVQMRLTQAEYDTLQALYKQSFYRERSVYLRRVLLRKEVLMKYKDESAGEILAALLRIKNELNLVGNNFNLAVRVLHTLSQIAEFRNWFLQHQNLPQTILKKLEECMPN